MTGRMICKACAAICLVGFKSHVRIMPEMGIERIGEDIWAGKALPDDQRRRDDEDQALRYPKDRKDL